MTRDVAVLVQALALVSCGRLGFDPLPNEADAATAPSDGGLHRDSVPERDAERPVRDARVDGADASLDGSLVPRDAGRDARSIPDSGHPEDALSPVDGAPGDAAPDADAGPSSGDFCEDIPALARAPVIEGTLEPGLTLRVLVPVGWTGADPIPAGHDARYALGWRPDGLYIYVRVRDATLAPAAAGDWAHCGDAVELYVDSDGTFTASPAYDVPGTMQFVVAAPDASGPARRGQRWNNVSQLQGDWTSTSFIASPEADGYSVEAFVAAADLDLSTWTLASGLSVGVALAVDLSDRQPDAGADAAAGCATRLGQYFNHIAPSASSACGVEPFCSTDAFCVAPLLP